MQMQFGYVMLVVQDMDHSIGFYKKLLQQNPEFQSLRWTQFRLGDFLLALHNANSWSDEADPLRLTGSGQKGVSFALYVDDLDMAIHALKAGEIKVIYGPRQTGIGNLVYVIDPDGHYIQICQPLKKA